jgi:hypothetical protein
MAKVHWSRRSHAASLLFVLIAGLLPTAGSLTAPPPATASRCALMDKLTTPRDNPRNACEAIARARHRSTYQPDSCLNFAAQMYGWGNTGWMSPRDMWQGMRPRLRHPNDRTPPAGALAIWRTSNPLGHVALVTRDGVISTDVPRRGRVNEVRLRWISKNWHANYVGWVMPHFPTAS